MSAGPDYWIWIWWPVLRPTGRLGGARWYPRQRCISTGHDEPSPTRDPGRLPVHPTQGHALLGPRGDLVPALDPTPASSLELLARPLPDLAAPCFAGVGTGSREEGVHGCAAPLPEHPSAVAIRRRGQCRTCFLGPYRRFAQDVSEMPACPALIAPLRSCAAPGRRRPPRSGLTGTTRVVCPGRPLADARQSAPHARSSQSPLTSSPRAPRPPARPSSLAHARTPLCHVGALRVRWLSLDPRVGAGVGRARPDVRLYLCSCSDMYPRFSPAHHCVSSAMPQPSHTHTCTACDRRNLAPASHMPRALPTPVPTLRPCPHPYPRTMGPVRNMEGGVHGDAPSCDRCHPGRPLRCTTRARPSAGTPPPRRSTCR